VVEDILLKIFLLTLLRERPGVLVPLHKKNPNSITELLDNGIEETSTGREKHTVKHNVVLWLHAFFAYSVFVDAN